MVLTQITEAATKTYLTVVNIRWTLEKYLLRGSFLVKLKADGV